MPARNRRSGIATVLATAVLASLLGLPSFGDADQSESEAAFAEVANRIATDSAAGPDGDRAAPSQEKPDAEPASGTTPPKLSVHGFLTQAYAQASYVEMPVGPDGVPLGFSPTSEELTIGIPEQGTFGYRFLALQFRYQMTPKDIMIVQLSSRALGVSPVGDIEDEIELDWAFYERRIGDQTSFKVGRVQIPLGIYNEIRDVGPVLPFYRPPYGFYSEGTFTSETIDGASLSHTFFPESNWSLDTSIYGGQFEQAEIDIANPQIAVTARGEDAWGFQLWLQTPLPDLRFGVGHLSYKTAGGIFYQGSKSPSLPHWFGSIEGSFGRFSLRSEYIEVDSSFVNPPFNLDKFFRSAFYTEVGLRITEKFHVWALYDLVKLEFTDSLLFVERNRFDLRLDTGIALNFFFAPDLVLKGEYHETEEEGLAGLIPVFTPEGLRFQPFHWHAEGGDYFIISLSASF